MEKIIKYKAFDGQEFDNEQDCIVYEKKITNRNYDTIMGNIWNIGNSFISIMESIKDMCNNRACARCKFNINFDCIFNNPFAWKIDEFKTLYEKYKEEN